MPDIKVTTWNIEHMNNWFQDTQSQVAPAFAGVAKKVARVIEEVKPDILCIQEGPTRKAQMENFAKEYLSGSWTVVRGETGGSQKPYILFRNFPPLTDFEVIDFNADEWKYSFLEFDEKKNSFFHRTRPFTRLPVEVIFHTASGAFSVIGLHLKSKIAILASGVKSTDRQKRTRAIGTALEQRARILQEGKLLRGYLQNHPFTSDVHGRFLLAGDLNDGPGRDFFEERYFGIDILRQVRGDIDHPEQILTEVLNRVPPADRFTAIFFDRIDNTLRPLLLDHLLVPPGFFKGTPRVVKPSARIEHVAYKKENEGEWSKKKKPARKKYPSDHRPASVKVRV